MWKFCYKSKDIDRIGGREGGKDECNAQKLLTASEKAVVYVFMCHTSQTMLFILEQFGNDL